MAPEKYRATMAIVNRLNKLAQKCDEVGVTMGNGGEIGSVLGAIADDLESQATEALMSKCDCSERSWYGAEHDSVCKLAGLPNPNSMVRP